MGESNNSLTEAINAQFQRELDRLIKEIESYQEESNLWKLNAGIKNSGGNLTLHLIGNLRHFIGHVLGGTGYKRERDAEFNDKHIARSKIISQIELTKVELDHIFPSLNNASLNEAYPINVMDTPWTKSAFLIHLLGHLNYHLGQINYHRRLLDS
jgi:hypothetical protein